MSINSVAFGQKGYPEQLRHIPDAPKLLYFSGPLAELCKEPCVAIVGSRKVTPYGRAVTEKLAGELARQGVVIVSGLALGVDSIAHEAALRAHGRTIAVLPRDIEHIYPVSHTGLAQRILSAGGALISEYPEGSDLHKFQFLERNRIIAGLSRGVIIPEAAARSGSLNTANAALEQGREVMAVPGNITSLLSAGTNNLLRLGATPITCVDDILQTLELTLVPVAQLPLIGDNDTQTLLLSLLGKGITDTELLLVACKLSPASFSQTLTMLEIGGRIRHISNSWVLA